MNKTYEIECKAWVDDPEVLRQELKQRYTFKTSYLKDDTYYNFPGRKQTFRVRKQGNDSIVTVKKKSRENGIEDNLEMEFNVSNADALDFFIREFDCPVYIRKRKNSEVYESEGITIELSFVDTLGWFLEIEKIVTSESAEDKKSAKVSIIKILEDLGIPENKIEERYYTEMLTGITERQDGNA